MSILYIGGVPAEMFRKHNKHGGLGAKHAIMSIPYLAYEVFTGHPIPYIYMLRTRYLEVCPFKAENSPHNKVDNWPMSWKSWSHDWLFQLGRAKRGGKTYRKAKPREDGRSKTIFRDLRKHVSEEVSWGKFWGSSRLRDLRREMEWGGGGGQNVPRWGGVGNCFPWGISSWGFAPPLFLAPPLVFSGSVGLQT